MGLMANYCHGQTVKIDSKGDYYQESDSLKVKEGIETGHTFTDKNGFVSHVLKSDKDRLFIIRRNKDGKPYRYYLKVEGVL